MNFSANVLIILSPPRSFSSVISNMLGQHPELYAFPELLVFSFDTVSEMIRKNKSSKGKVASDGLLRTLTQEHYEIQSNENVLRSIDWLMTKQDWSIQQLFTYLTDLISPQMGIEKSPRTCLKPKYLAKAYSCCPSAYFLHLTRNPISARKSLNEFLGKTNRKKRKIANFLDGLLIWYRLHQNIIRFTNTLPLGQTMRIKGEDILSQPDIYLPQIATWLGVSTDKEAIAQMKHPENSPYAYIGPSLCRGGNDVKFMNNPVLRQARVPQPSVSKFMKGEKWQSILSDTEEFANYRQTLDPSYDPEQVTEELINLANLLGYQ